MTKFKPMSKAMRERWKLNLRSGEYKQGTGTLRNVQGGFCCLGVLADTELDGWWIEYSERALQLLVPGCGTFIGDFGDVGEDPQRSEAVLAKLGMTKEQMHTFVQLNDQHGISFDQIAQRVDEILGAS